MLHKNSTCLQIFQRLKSISWFYDDDCITKFRSCISAQFINSLRRKLTNSKNVKLIAAYVWISASCSSNTPKTHRFISLETFVIWNGEINGLICWEVCLWCVRAHRKAIKLKREKYCNKSNFRTILIMNWACWVDLLSDLNLSLEYFLM